MLERVSQRRQSPLTKPPRGSFGRRIPDAVRRGIPDLGVDLSRIRIHADEAAAQSAAALGAEAFAAGDDIFFGTDAYRPESTEGRRLLFHELAHVAQRQKGAAVGGATSPLLADASLDRNADHVADALLVGRTPRVQAGTFQVGLTPKKPPEYKQHPCDDAEPTNAKIIGFIKAHRTDAASVAKKAGVPSDWILAVSANETEYGTRGIVERTNNYFGLHVNGEKDTTHYEGQTGVEKTRGTPAVFVAVFGARGYKDSGVGFVTLEHSNISGLTEFKSFAQKIHDHGYGVDTKSYVADLISVHDLIAARIDCATAG